MLGFKYFKEIKEIKEMNEKLNKELLEEHLKKEEFKAMSERLLDVNGEIATDNQIFKHEIRTIINLNENVLRKPSEEDEENKYYQALLIMTDKLKELLGDVF